MCRIALSFVAAVCALSAAYATECSSGPGYRFPITCPGLLDSTESYCCEKSGSFQCCNEEEFARQEGSNEDTEPIAQASYQDYNNIVVSSYEDGLGAAAIGGIFLAIIIPVALICCCCCCCACCPCYHWCHPNTTNVTVVQPSFSYPGLPINGQNNFNSMVPNQPGMPQDLPPQYVRGSGYSKLSVPGDRESNYIQ